MPDPDPYLIRSGFSFPKARLDFSSRFESPLLPPLPTFDSVFGLSASFLRSDSSANENPCVFSSSIFPKHQDYFPSPVLVENSIPS